MSLNIIPTHAASISLFMCVAACSFVIEIPMTTPESAMIHKLSKQHSD